MAKAAMHPRAIAAHEEMAQRYDALLEAHMRPSLHVAA
jgi:hypothetical protein